MSKIIINSYIYYKSFDQQFDYKTDFCTNQTFISNKSISFYKNVTALKAKQYSIEGEKNYPSDDSDNELIFNIEKINNNNKELYFFIPIRNKNTSNEKISYHDYRLIIKNKKRETPSFISLYDFNCDKKDIYNKSRKRKNDFMKHYKNSYELNIGDVIKLGRVSLILTKIHLESNNLANCETLVEGNINKSNNNSIKYNKIIKDICNQKILKKKSNNMIIKLENESNSEKKDICRICFLDEKEGNSPLLSLCKCSGDSKFIHLNCLSQWLKVKSEIYDSPNNMFKNIIFDTINCEICKEKFPELVYDINKNKSYQIYNPEYYINSSINNTYHNYVVFESFELINQKKIIYIINLDKKNKITMGRSQSSDVKINDLTVSRVHSLLLRTKDNKIMIKDLGSKFGTLILLQSKKVLINEKILPIQIGKIFVKIHMEYNKLNYMLNNLFNCILYCFRCNKKKEEKKKENQKVSYTNNNKLKKPNLDDSNFNMVMINNYFSSKDSDSLDYNYINMKGINIEEILDIKYKEDYN